MEDKIKLGVICVTCQKTTFFLLTKEQYADLISGEKFIQDIFPEMPAAERELFISNVCGECFSKMFSEEEY